MTEKTCRACGTSKSLDDFHRLATSKDGRHARCKACVSAYMRDYHSRNLERNRHRAKVWAQANPERVKDNHAAWRASQTADQYEARRVRMRITDAVYRARNADKIAARSASRKEARRNAPPVSLALILQRDGRHCHICDQDIRADETLHYDHVIPLARGGTHTEANLKVAHGRCNAWKADRTMDELVGHTPETDRWQDERGERLRKLRREQMLARWNNPVQAKAIRDAISAGMRGRPQPANTAKWQDPAYRERQSASRKASWARAPERRMAQSARNRAWHTDNPERNRMRIAKIVATKGQKKAA